MVEAGPCPQRVTAKPDPPGPLLPIPPPGAGFQFLKTRESQSGHGTGILVSQV